MDDERLIILKMVQAGKITAEDAVALLDALTDNLAGAAETATSPVQSQQEQASIKPQSSNTQTDGYAEINTENEHPSFEQAIQDKIDAAVKRVEQVSGRVAEQGPQLVEHMAGKVAEQMGKLGEKLAGLSKLNALENLNALGSLANLGNLAKHAMSMGPCSEVTETFTGNFGTENELWVEVGTKNGGITVKSWDEPGYKVVAVKKVRTDNPDEAERISVDAVEVSVEANRLRVISHENNVIQAVSFTLFVPSDRTYNILTDTTNGGLHITKLVCRNCRAETTNGGISITDLKTDELIAETTNGAIAANGVNARKVKAETTNGSVNWNGSACEVMLETTNGSIRVRPMALNVDTNAVASGQAVPAKYHLESCNGSIAVALEGAAALASVHFHAETSHGRISMPDGGRVVRRDDTIGSRELVAELPGNSERLDLYTETNHGAITLTRA